MTENPLTPSASAAQGDATYPAALAHRLRREILTGALPPGSPVKERDNAERLGVSRTPLREAVRILAQEGLLVLRPLRSPVVADQTLAEALDEIAVLRRLEVFSGELACQNAIAEQIAHIRALAEAVARDHGTGDKIDVFDMDMDMHRAIAAAGANAALARTHGEYLSRLWRIRFLSASRRSDAEAVLGDHAGMVAALEARDAGAMQRHIDAHFDRFVRNVTEHFAGRADLDADG